MNNNTTKTLILFFAVLLCFSAVGSCFALYTLNAEPLSITITAAVPERELQSITASYTGGDIFVGQSYDPNELSVDANYTTGEPETLESSQYTVEITSGTNTAAGTVTYTVTYQGQTDTFTITVLPNMPYLLGTYGTISNQWTPNKDAEVFSTSSGGNKYTLLNISLEVNDVVKVYDKSTETWVSFAGSLPFGADYDTNGNLVIHYAGNYNFYYSTDGNIYVTSDVKGLYLKPNSNWTQSNAWFAAYFFGNGEKWAKMNDTNSDGVYEVLIPSGYTMVIFCRMNPASSSLSWNNKWDQTGDLTIPTNGNNLFTIPNGAWSGSTTTWSTK